MSTKVKRKTHADFQDAYHRSSNFNKITKRERFKPKGNGVLKMEQEQEEE
jgi:hypothetical protein